MPDKEMYVVCCVFCRSNENLMMFAHRRHGDVIDSNRIVGWVFVCGKCRPSMDQKIIEVVIKDES